MNKVKKDDGSRSPFLEYTGMPKKVTYYANKHTGSGSVRSHRLHHGKSRISTICDPVIFIKIKTLSAIQKRSLTSIIDESFKYMIEKYEVDKLIAEMKKKEEEEESQNGTTHNT